MKLVEVCRLSKVFGPSRQNRKGERRVGVPAVTDLTLAIESGEALGLVGESGSGKSTLARCILGLENPTSGEIRYAGQLLDGPTRRRLAGRIQAVFQDPHQSLNPRMTVARIVLEPLEILSRGSAASRLGRASEVMTLVGLAPDLLEQRPDRLSGGQKQRVAIARALVGEPELLIADEPVSALDLSVQAQILNLLADLRNRFNLTVLLISHDLGVVGQFCDRVAVMVKGRLVEVAPTARLFSDPRHPYTRSLLASLIPTSAGEARKWIGQSVATWEGGIGELREETPGHWVAALGEEARPDWRGGSRP